MEGKFKMNSDRIKEIQEKTAYPNSVSVQQALLQVWNECEQENKSYSEQEMNRYASHIIECIYTHKEFLEPKQWREKNNGV